MGLGWGHSMGSTLFEGINRGGGGVGGGGFLKSFNEEQQGHVR